MGSAAGAGGAVNWPLFKWAGGNEDKYVFESLSISVSRQHCSTHQFDSYIIIAAIEQTIVTEPAV